MPTPLNQDVFLSILAMDAYSRGRVPMNMSWC
jgi:hypothetical protein